MQGMKVSNCQPIKLAMLAMFIAELDFTIQAIALHLHKTGIKGKIKHLVSGDEHTWYKGDVPMLFAKIDINGYVVKHLVCAIKEERNTENTNKLNINI